MKILYDFLFFEDADTNGVSDNELKIANQGAQAAVSVTGDAVGLQLYISGRVDYNTDEYTPLACINASNFNVTEFISGNGVYYIPTDGVNRLRAEIKAINGGSATVVAKIGE